MHITLDPALEFFLFKFEHSNKTLTDCALRYLPFKGCSFVFSFVSLALAPAHITALRDKNRSIIGCIDDPVIPKLDGRITELHRRVTSRRLKLLFSAELPVPHLRDS
jgi:hypothetical protein